MLPNYGYFYQKCNNSSREFVNPVNKAIVNHFKILWQKNQREIKKNCNVSDCFKPPYFIIYGQKNM